MTNKKYERKMLDKSRFDVGNIFLKQYTFYHNS